ncbi:concanavalin A-like lectin/glucanase domain-containing protein [Ganoderma leucocontextum]|nr:concanavalin A-like lectin/glucanase domain-containing protein [Ganoderma leucocontextum]
MIVHVPLAIFLLANAAPTDAALFLRTGSDSLLRVAQHARRHVSKRSTGLWDDMRLVYTGMFQQKPQILQSKPYCTHNAGTGLPVSGTGVVDGTSAAAHGSSSTTSGSTATSAAHTASSSASVSVTGTGTAPSSSATSGSSQPSSPWKVAQSYEGSSFFDGWVFTNEADIWTSGIAQYVDQSTAQSAGLIEINDAGNAVMRVETTHTVSGNRQSIRITTEYTYTGGLIILDAVHMPTGCGTWPAFWSTGPNWPTGGEIDIVEGLNDYTNNQVTVHTNPGCTMPSDPNVLNMTGSFVTATDCGSTSTSNVGCGVRASQTNSFGAAFNSINGGVYAILWDETGWKVWFYPRGSIPGDISNGAPLPSGWGKPMADFPSTSCDAFKFFYQHSAVFDTTLCGQWGDGVWASDNAPGQSQTCAQRTGVASCEDFVRANGAAFSEAYWEVKSVKVYQNSS